MMPVFVGDWLKATRLLTVQERGVLFDLLCFQWEHRVLPPEPERLARLVGVSTSEFSKHWRAIADWFAQVDGGLVNHELDEHRTKAIGIVETRSRVAHQAAVGRWKAEKAKDDPPPAAETQTRTKKKATRIPDDFELTPGRRQIAVDEGIDPERTFTKFCNFWIAKGGKDACKVDWDRTWHNWCMEESRRAAGSNGAQSRKPFIPAPTTAELELLEKGEGGAER
jgi:uncharacterized protein YdaU (DUF1376 family)